MAFFNKIFSWQLSPEGSTSKIIKLKDLETVNSIVAFMNALGTVEMLDKTKCKMIFPLTTLGSYYSTSVLQYICTVGPRQATWK